MQKMSTISHFEASEFPMSDGLQIWASANSQGSVSEGLRLNTGWVRWAQQAKLLYAQQCPARLRNFILYQCEL